MMVLSKQLTWDVPAAKLTARTSASAKARTTPGHHRRQAAQ